MTGPTCPRCLQRHVSSCADAARERQAIVTAWEREGTRKRRASDPQRRVEWRRLRREVQANLAAARAREPFKKWVRPAGAAL